MGKEGCAMEKLLGVSGLVVLLGLQKKTLRNWMSLNEFNLKDHLSKVGRRWRIDLKGYEELTDECNAATLCSIRNYVNQYYIIFNINMLYGTHMFGRYKGKTN
jgi:hypothetical protein